MAAQPTRAASRISAMDESHFQYGLLAKGEMARAGNILVRARATGSIWVRVVASKGAARDLSVCADIAVFWGGRLLASVARTLGLELNEAPDASSRPSAPQSGT